MIIFKVLEYLIMFLIGEINQNNWTLLTESKHLFYYLNLPKKNFDSPNLKLRTSDTSFKPASRQSSY